MAPAPWDKVSPEDQLFVLVTGANSGIGLGIGQRLIDEFLASRPSRFHLTVITTTRSVQKSRETVEALRKHLKRAAQSSKRRTELKDVMTRVHLVSVELDLCKLPSVYETADLLVHGTISSPCETGEFESLNDIRIPRLDAVICNAGIGGWWGIDWPLVVKNLFTRSIPQAFTWPIFKGANPGLLVDVISGRQTTLEVSSPDTDERLFGELFAANLFGHYIFCHQLLPLLSRPKGSSIPPGRIVWETSVESLDWDNFSLDDFQGLKSPITYESTKRLTDILALTSTLPAARAISAPYLTAGNEPAGQIRPKIYLIHPGVVCSSLFPINFILFYAYMFAMYLARWLGSPWHPVTAYLGAIAPVWLVLQSQTDLDALNGEHIKWGSACTRSGKAIVKQTEVEGWGWEGRVEDRKALAQDKATRVLRKSVGRKAYTVDLTQEKREDFEALGAECWREMERLRLKWDGIIKARGKATANGKA